MESIEKLREFAETPPHVFREELIEFADEIERDIAERFAELPVDADGEPIHVGDSIEYPNGTHDVVRFITVNDNVPTFNESGWVASKCRHVKPDPIKELLEEFVLTASDKEISTESEVKELFAEYAEKIRKAVKSE